MYTRHTDDAEQVTCKNCIRALAASTSKALKLPQIITHTDLGTGDRSSHSVVVDRDGKISITVHGKLKKL